MLDPRKLERSVITALIVSSTMAACAVEPAEESASTRAAICSTECQSGSLRGDALLTPVNRSTGLREDWAPTTTELPDAYETGPGRALRTGAYERFTAMVDAARAESIELVCLSGYRSFDTQCNLFASYAASNGCENANTFSAHAGHSEHQLGTVCDVAPKASGTFLVAGSREDRWLTAHAHEYGFACSYPNADARLNDGYIHEPWHYRYIGVAAARELKRREALLPAGQRLSVPVFIAQLTATERAALEATTPPPDQGDPGDPGPATPSCSTIPFAGRCTGTVLEYCANGEYRRVDCAQKTDGRTTCGEDPRDTVGKNCIQP